MSTKTSAVLRAFGVVGATAALVTGVTFAALNSSATLTASSILSATADLKLSNGGSFASNAPGFTITDLVPGTGVTKPLYFQNAGGVGLNITANIPTLPAAPGGGYGFTGFDNLTVTITSEACPTPVMTNMLALNAGQVALPCNPLPAGAIGNSGVHPTVGNYSIKFDINPAAITGSQAGVGPFDIVFTGTQY